LPELINETTVSHPLRKPFAAPARRRAKLFRPLLIAAGILGVGAGIWYFTATQSKPPEPERAKGPPASPVAVATAVTGDIALNLDGLGTVTPLATVTIRTRINGQLTRLGFTEGQMVKQGDFLAEIDPRPYRIAVNQAEGLLRHDQALLKNARLDLERYRKLVKEDSIARQQLDTQDSLVHQYEGTVLVDQAQLDNAKLNLDYCHIVAPISGRIGLRQADLGNYLQSSDANGIAVVTQLQPITVVFTLPEDNLPGVTKRLAGGRKLPVMAFDRSRTERLAEGVLESLDNQIDTTTGTVKLKAQFDNKDGTLFPNQFVNARLLVDTLHDATIVPSAAILRGAPGTYVYAVDAENKVKVQPVTLGATEGRNVAIAAGLEPGARVVVDGTDRLREGMTVTVAEGGSPPEASGERKPGRKK